MKNQPNDIVTLEWLLPLFNQQLSRVSDGWQLGADSTDYERMIEPYRQIGGALTMIRLPLLANLANKLNLLAEASRHDGLSTYHHRIGQFSHELLHRELNQYAHTSSHHIALIHKAVDELTQALSKLGIATDSLVGLTDNQYQHSYNDVDNNIIDNIEVIVPTSRMLTHLEDHHYQQLLLAWRQQVQALLVVNTNESSLLAILERVSQYLWQTTQNGDLQRLWYLTERWLTDLTHNDTPLPEHYAPLLSQLEQMIEPCANQAELPSSVIRSLILKIYIELSGLGQSSKITQSILNGLSQSTPTAPRFLSRILGELETLIFNLDKPDTLLTPLQKVKSQLEGRGWTYYVSQVESILTDIEHALSSENGFAQEQWQIERKLQELYSAIYNTEQTISIKIGGAASFVTGSEALDSVDNQVEDSHDIASADADLRELRIAVEEVKQNFDEYVQRQNIHLLPDAADFIAIGDAFADMGLPAIRQTMDEMASIFAQLASHKIAVLSWDVIQALAEALISIELLLDYLAQQVFDQQLLTQASEHTTKAIQLLNVYIEAPETINDTFLTQKPAAMNVLRYDDSGEIAPVIISDVDNEDTNNISDHTVNSNTVNNIVESEALTRVREQIKPDNFEIDEDIRDIFIEEVTEVVSDLEDFLPIWQQDSQDLTPLTEVRRGFHTLKGSGRMVGAFSISEMAWSIENLLNRLLDKTLSVTDEVVNLVIETTTHLPALVADFEAQQSPSFDPALIILQSHNLMAQQPINTGLPVPELTDNETESDNNQSVLANSSELDISRSIDDIEASMLLDTVYDSDKTSNDSENKKTAASLATLEIPAVLVPFMQKTEQLPADASDADPDIKEIFLEEANEVLVDITPLFEGWRLSTTDLSGLADIRRGFHTLKGSGRMVGAHYTAELAWAIEDMLNRILDRSVVVSEDMCQLIADVLAAYPTMLTVFENDSQDYPVMMPLWIACAKFYSKQQHDEFSYAALFAQQHEPEGNGSEYEVNQSSVGFELSGSDSTYLIHDNTNEAIDITLQTFNYVNEMIAEAPIVLAPQSEKEKVFCEIFIDEAEGLLQDIDQFVDDHKDEPYVEVTDEIVRAFHTLRGASGSSALAAISEVSATIEHSLELLQQQDTAMNAQHLEALARSATLMDGYLTHYKQNVQPQNVAAEEMHSQQDIVSLQAMLDEQHITSDTKAVSDKKPTIEQLLDNNIDELLDAEWELDAALNNSEIEQVQGYMKRQISQIHHLTDKAQAFPKFALILNELGNAYVYLNNNLDKARDTNVQAILHAGHAQLVGLFDALAGSTSLKMSNQVLEDLHSIYQDDANNDDGAFIVRSVSAPELELEFIDTDAELLEIFLEEAQELDAALDESFNKWRTDITNINSLKVLQRHLHTIKGGARMAGIRSIGDLTHEAESVYESFVESRRAPTEQWLEIMQMVQDTMSLQVMHIVNYKQSFFASDLIEQLQQFEKAKTLPETVELIIPVPKNNFEPETQSKDAENTYSSDEADTLSLDRMIQQSWANGLPDPDILAVFLEEAEELTNRNKYLHLFLKDTNNTTALQALQRDLHTIKGGARMVTATGIADLAHEMESVYKDFVDNRRPATKKVLELLVASHDWLADAVFILRQQVNPPTPALLIEALQQFGKNPDSLKQIPKESLQVQREAIFIAKEKQDSQYLAKDISEMPSMLSSVSEDDQATNNNEMIRISGGLIEHMINLSGESAINRARIDMGITSLTNSIEDMGTTVQRLADQLRRMEIELEAQILSQIDDELIQNEDFDPLEMDQYSSLNQLSKSLTESASDLVDINHTLLEKTRDSESLLLQLSRTQTELQDGLMNSRMVPFTRLTPRLERIVRQTANELNKSVELTIINADDEMDRTILERITSPLEHMLRNAVDHGIENTSTRLRAGKERSGRITLEVHREGSEIVIELSDDGRGIDVEAVRNKAISQGLIDADDYSLTDLDIMQYIFNAGLSTSKQVTQISGRGVGMDVVISEIRQLGGAVSVVSELGQGSRFTMRLPLTVAVSDALVVRAADRYYAIPLVQIERVVRVNPEKLYDYYQSNAATLNFEDVDYRVRYLNEILSGNKLNELVVNTNTSLPLIIIKNRTGHNIALQVDQIAGSRIEVVVKPLGKQLSNLSGISAATIMGDGSVMLILDLIALMRNAQLVKNMSKSADSKRKSIAFKSTILVVDDSVTVRKVTSRFLERQGFNVAVAKDGIDAIEILQDTTPDMILLDIEMPRMDGFEVATQVRHNQRLQHIPIIMITSRTGEKHRERALEVGVNDYMGKPFQEQELLNKIQGILGKKVSLTHEG
ncbi:Hpt domain-containing protein [Psychrobacter aquaticus]|uniref:Chemotaxis protein CheA n=1 Tax=Psychrobacter aquaticus CMS 56 TaxID=1354303 RepID=U4T539_9GAMM|nr:Hpt domain-containing protein [Psychrobacter aquaticus]ERL56020.1 Signal transduction histidine kinase CheA [Psychrobacter aquaticus CMS 56]